MNDLSGSLTDLVKIRLLKENLIKKYKLILSDYMSLLEFVSECESSKITGYSKKGSLVLPLEESDIMNISTMLLLGDSISNIDLQYFDRKFVRRNYSILSKEYYFLELQEGRLVRWK